jgi:hypothetical protein
MTEPPTPPRPADPRVAGVLDALRDGWHGLGGGDAERCPGCPVCRLSETAGRLDPATTEHLRAAATHLVSAGRELLAALARTGDGPAGEPAMSSTTEPDVRPADPTVPAAPPRTTIPVGRPDGPAGSTTTSPPRGDEEQA